MPVAFSVQGFLDGSKTAMLTVSVPADRYIDLADTIQHLWRPVHDLKHGDSVQAVSHFGRHFTRVGTITTIRSLETHSEVKMLITAIHFVEVAKLTDQDIADLGYSTRAAWELDWGNVLEKRTGWFVRLIPADPHSPQ